MQSKRVLIATGLFPPEIGGPATYSKLLSEELVKKGFNVSVLPFSEVRKYPKFIRHFFYFLKVLLKARQADLVYAQDPVSVGLAAMLASKILRKRFILKIVGDYAWEQAVLKYAIKESLEEFWEKKYPLKIKILKKVEKFVASLAEKIIVPSFYLKKIVSNWGIDEKHIRVIYNSFEACVINESKNDLRKKFNMNGKVLITAGRLVPWKGYHEVIKSMERLKDEFPDIKLFIAGDGPQINNLKNLISESKLENCVFLLGRLENRELLERIRASDVFVLNSSYEGFSHIILECLSQGVPAVVTSVGGNVEIIHGGYNGFLFEKDNMEQFINILKNIFSDDGLYKKISISSYLSLKKFGKEEMIKQLVEELAI